MSKHKKKRGPGESAHSTVEAGTVSLNDDEMETLDSIIKHWNAAKKTDAPDWNANTVLAHLATLALRSMTEDYSEEGRKPTFTDQPTITPPPLDEAPENP